MRTALFRKENSLLYVFLFVILGVSLLPGCRLQQTGEPPAMFDSPPPPGYAPIYVKRTLPFSTAADKAAVQVSRIETTEPTRIRAYVHVVDSSGIYLTGAAANGTLKKWWCEVKETVNGVTQPITDFTLHEVTEKDRAPHAIALVMDHSGSMGETRAFAVQDAAERLLVLKKQEDALTLVKYDDKVVVEAPLTGSSATLNSGLQKNGLIGFGGLTAIGNGIAAGIVQLANADKSQRKAVVVFTDGLDNSSTIDRNSVIAMAKRENVIVCAVDFGENTDSDYLQTIASETGGTYHHMYGTDEFDDVFEDIYRRLHNYYVLEYRPRQFGVHTIELKLCMDKEAITTNATYDNTPDLGAVVLLDVHFDVNKADIKKESEEVVESVYRLMSGIPAMRIEVRGHTDSTNSTGDPEYNTKLSQRRADAVKAALVKKGITPERIASYGFGETKPVADNETPEGRALNRRTEFVITAR